MTFVDIWFNAALAFKRRETIWMWKMIALNSIYQKNKEWKR